MNSINEKVEKMRFNLMNLIPPKAKMGYTMNKEKQQKVLLQCTIILLLVIGAAALMVQGIPKKYDLLYTLRRSDPILQYYLGVNQADDSTEATSDYVLKDDKSLYNLNDITEVTVLLLEVHTAEEYSLSDLESPDIAENLKLPVVIREGTAQGTVKWEGFGYDAMAPNATIEVKGVPKENRKYHNFKIRLKNVAGRYEGQTIINLKKGYGKPCRAEEKFAFDLFASLPNMMSLRTEFVHVYVKNADAPSPYYESYGIYTLVEQPDENYFLNRSLDTSANMYQAENFSFRKEDVLLDISDPDYNKKAFETVLDIKQGTSHTDLLAAIDAVNNRNKDIDEVIEEHFNRDNVFTWMAMNVILGNQDVATKGYLLYKPLMSSVWFFLPANMSETMWAVSQESLMEEGIDGCVVFEGNLLYERILKSPENRQELIDRVDELMQYFSEGTVENLTNQYIVVLSQYLAVNPDKGILKDTPDQVIANISRYYEIMQYNVSVFEEKWILNTNEKEKK